MLSARAIAVLYDLHLAAVWRGENPAGLFATWLAAHWCPGIVQEPDTVPDAVSVLGGSGNGIRFYTIGNMLVGYVSGRANGCYIISPEDETVPAPILLPDHLSFHSISVVAEMIH